MSTLVTSVHVIVAFILIVSVLLQTGKGSGLGAAFGGSSSSVFGARGPATIISRVTSVAAIVFMVTSLTLSIFAHGGSRKGSVIVADEPPPPAAAAPAEGRAVSEEAIQTPVAPAGGQADGATTDGAAPAADAAATADGAETGGSAPADTADGAAADAAATADGAETGEAPSADTAGGD